LKITTLILAFLLCSAAASAQVPKGNVFFGYSYVSADFQSGDRANLNGWNGSLEGKFLPWVGIVADLSGHYGSREITVCPPLCTPVSADARMYNFLFGPRVSVSVGKVRPFAEALFGAGHISTDGFGSDTGFSTAVGGGLDYHLVPLVSWRVQGDFLNTRFFGDSQNNFRLSTGIVLNF
jgi:hypothetical protein